MSLLVDRRIRWFGGEGVVVSQSQSTHVLCVLLDNGKLEQVGTYESGVVVLAPGDS